MEITPLTLYLFYLFDAIKDACGPLVFLTGILSVASVLGWFMANGDPYISREATNRFVKVGKIALIVCVCTFVANIALPSGKAMVAMYVVPKVVNNEVAQQLPGEILDFIRSYLKENTVKRTSDI